MKRVHSPWSIVHRIRINKLFFGIKIYGLWSVVCGLFFCSCAKPVYKDTFVISGTYLEVISTYREAAAIVYREFQRLDKVFNFYDADSQISVLNRSYNSTVGVSDEMMEVLKIAKEINQSTQGCFDITAGALYSFWKKLIQESNIEELPSAEAVKYMQQQSGFDNIDIDADNKQVTLKKEGLKIDLGGIAKGYMVDKAIEKLKQNKIDSAIISAGGDIYCLGKNRGKSWQIGIKNPYAQGIIEKQELVNEAIATSGGYEQFIEINKQKFSHLIDPRDGFPVRNNILSVSVIADKCVIADSLATAFFIMGIDAIDKFFSGQMKKKVKAIIVSDKDGEKKVEIFVGAELVSARY